MNPRHFRNRAVFLLARQIRLRQSIDPEVGFPPLWWMQVDEALRALHLRKADVDYQDIVAQPPRR